MALYTDFYIYCCNIHTICIQYGEDRQDVDLGLYVAVFIVLQLILLQYNYLLQEVYTSRVLTLYVATPLVIDMYTNEMHAYLRTTAVLRKCSHL